MATGSVNLSLNLATDINGSISINGPAQAMTLTPGQRGFYTFNGTAGQNLGLGYTGMSLSGGGNLSFEILKPDGTQLFYDTTAGNNSSNVTPALPVNGTYTLKVVPSVSTGTASVNVWLSSDVTGTLTGGGSVAYSTVRPGQNGRYTFNATAGQNLVFNPTGNTFSSGYASIKKPNGASLGSTAFVNPYSWISLPDSGTYTVFMDPSDVATGSVNMGLNLATDVNGSISVDGPALAVTLTPGQRGFYTFTGTAGQNLGLAYTGMSLSAGGNVWIGLFKPNGAGQLFEDTSSGNSSSNVTPALPVTGTYTLAVVPSAVIPSSVRTQGVR